MAHFRVGALVCLGRPRISSLTTSAMLPRDGSCPLAILGFRLAAIICQQLPSQYMAVLLLHLLEELPHLVAKWRPPSHGLAFLQPPRHACEAILLGQRRDFTTVATSRQTLGMQV